MVRVKVCGITNLEDALQAVSSGADAIGFVFYKKSRRFVESRIVRSISRGLPPFVSKVGVFVNEDKHRLLEILSYASLDYAQLHGDESPDYCYYVGPDRVIKAFRIKDGADAIETIKPYIEVVSAILLDTFVKGELGGTGKTFSWEIALKVKERFPEVPLILSGGLTAENVKKAIDFVKPFAVDVSSGVELSPGKKDPLKLKRFLKEAKCFL